MLVFGATGSAGGRVLRACLAAPFVEEVRADAPSALAAARQAAGFVHGDDQRYDQAVEAFKGVDVENAEIRDIADRAPPLNAGRAGRGRVGARAVTIGCVTETNSRRPSCSGDV